MSKDFKNISVTAEAVEQARRLGLYGNVPSRLALMARNSAPVTHTMGNRRFESFILRIQNDVVMSICRFNPGTGEVVTDMMTRLNQAYPPGTHKPQ